MQLFEVAYTVNRSGSLRIPQADIAKMGLCAGDHLRVAFLTNDGITNSYKEFLISSGGVESPVSDSKDMSSYISIPSSLLEQADISPDADIQIVCADGAIIISRDTLNSNELRDVLESLSYAENLVQQIPGNGFSALNLLGNCLDDTEKEGFGDEF